MVRPADLKRGDAVLSPVGSPGVVVDREPGAIVVEHRDKGGFWTVRYTREWFSKYGELLTRQAAPPSKWGKR